MSIYHSKEEIPEKLCTNSANNFEWKLQMGTLLQKKLTPGLLNLQYMDCIDWTIYIYIYYIHKYFAHVMYQHKTNWIWDPTIETYRHHWELFDHNNYGLDVAKHSKDGSPNLRQPDVYIYIYISRALPKAT